MNFPRECELEKYDLVEMSGGRYGGVFDRTLKKVLMKQYGDILELPVKDFDAYFRNDSLLDYLKVRVKLILNLNLSLNFTLTPIIQRQTRSDALSQALPGKEF